MGRMKRQDIFLLNGRQHGFCSLASRVLFPFLSPSLLLSFPANSKTNDSIDFNCFRSCSSSFSLEQ